MRIRFASRKLEALYIKEEGAEQYPTGVVAKYRQRVDFILAANDERDLRAMKSLHFEKLKGSEGLHSMRLNQSYRLELSFEQDDAGRLVAVIRISNHYQP